VNSPNVVEPVIKWSGSKRGLVPVIAPLVSGFNSYFEPFVGGGSVLGNIGPVSSTASDIVPELIELWKLIRDQPDFVSSKYRVMWTQLQRRGNSYYNFVRARFNRHRAPEDLFFLSRTCVNGLIRFNKVGDFNNSLHHTRPGIHPSRLEKILSVWAARVSKTEFRTCDFEETTCSARKGDVVYLDPPYMNNKGRYTSQDFDFSRLWGVLESLNSRSVSWVLSIDGTSGARDYSSQLEVPRALAVSELQVPAGNSPFPKLLVGRTDRVRESIFTNFDANSRIQKRR